MNRVAERLSLAALLVASGTLYLVAIGADGWANVYYSAAAQAGATDWTAFLYGSSDAANSITVDKPPAAIWLMDISVRLLGLSPASVLLPQALLGVATVAVVYATVRRLFPAGVALFAGATMAVTPAAALIFRYNNPDALLTLLLAVALYALVRTHDDLRVRWLLLVGAAFGFAFLTKQLQAFLVVPAFAAVFLWTAAGPLRDRVRRALIVLAALVVSAGWWVAIVLIVPSGSRPWIGGSPDDNFLSLTLGYNGLGRIFGGDGNGTSHGGIDRLLIGSSGGLIGWLLPAASVLLILALVRLRKRPRRDPERAMVAALAGGLFSTAVALSGMSGTYHSYYTVAAAPFLAAGLAVGGALLWRIRELQSTRIWLAAIVFGSGCWAFLLLMGAPPSPGSIRWIVLLSSAVAAILLTTTLAHARMRAVVVGLTIASLLLAPAATSTFIASQAHAGSGAAPTALAADRSLTLGVDPAVLAALQQDASGYRWVAATARGSSTAAKFQLASGYAVMPIGGYKHRDPSPTLPQFQAQVARGEIHWFIAGPTSAGAGTGAIARWVGQNFFMQEIGGLAMYDLTRTPASVAPGVTA